MYFFAFFRTAVYPDGLRMTTTFSTDPEILHPIIGQNSLRSVRKIGLAIIIIIIISADKEHTAAAPL